MKALQSTEFSDFSFGLSRRGLTREGFGNSLAVDLVGQAEIGPMAWILRQVAMAVRFAASAHGGSDRAATQVAQSCDLIGNVGPLLLERLERFGGRHSASSYPSVLYTHGLS